MLASLGRIIFGVIIAAALVAATTGVLVMLPRAVSFGVTLAGVALLMSAETFQSKAAAGVGGVMAMGGVLAWALISAKLIGAATAAGF